MQREGRGDGKHRPYPLAALQADAWMLAIAPALHASMHRPTMRRVYLTLTPKSDAPCEYQDRGSRHSKI
jgi:hypothetical protein